MIFIDDMKIATSDWSNYEMLYEIYNLLKYVSIPKYSENSGQSTPTGPGKGVRHSQVSTL